MPVYDSNGNLKVAGNLTTDVRESGSVIVPEAGFLDFRSEGANTVTVTASGNGAIITISGSGGITDHGALSGLADDDHTQYLHVSGARAMAGNLNMGSFNIIVSGTVDGRDPSVDGAKLDTIDAGAQVIAILSGSTGQIVTSSIDFINFAGPGISSVVISGSGVTVTTTTGSGGGGGGSGITSISKGGTFLDPIIPNDVVVWRANGSYTISAVRAYLSGTTAASASINTRVNSSNNLSSNLFVTTSGNWWEGDTPINTAVSAGDSLEIRLLSLSGSVKYVNIQVDLSSS